MTRLMASVSSVLELQAHTTMPYLLWCLSMALVNFTFAVRFELYMLAVIFQIVDPHLF